MSWRRFLHRKQSDAELQDEIEAFLAEEAADNQARGMSPDEARRQAHLKLGNRQKVRESLWAQNSPQPFTAIGRDLKYALRTLSSHARLLDHRDWSDGFVHRCGNFAFYDCALSLAKATSLPGPSPAGDGVRASTRGRTHRIPTSSRWHPRIFTTGARRRTALKTWPSWVTPGSV